MSFVAFVFWWSVVDGDTIDVNARVWPNHAAHEERVRFVRIDAPEMHAKLACERDLAMKAKMFTAAALTNGKEIVLKVSIEKPQRDSFGRILGDVIVDGISLPDAGLAAGVFRPYAARGTPWC